jgi:hypothetical protein
LLLLLSCVLLPLLLLPCLEQIEEPRHVTGLIQLGCAARCELRAAACPQSSF